MSTRAVTVLLAILLVSSDAWGAPRYKKGDVCTVTETIRLTSKPRGRGRKSKLEPSSEVEVIGQRKQWVKVQVGDIVGFLKARVMARFCEKRDDDVPDPAPELASIAPDQPAEVSYEEDSDPEVDAAQPVAAASVAEAPAAPAQSDAFGDTYRIKLAVLDLQGANNLSRDVVASLTNVIPETLDALGPFKAISSQDIVKMLNFEANKQALGCDDMSCLAEIGGALGADFLVSGSLTYVGDTYVTQLQLTNISEAKVVERVSREYQGGEQGLFEEIRMATRILVRELLGERSGMLMVRANEEGATVKVDGVIVGVTPMGATEVAGGAHELTVEKEGFVVSRQDFNVAQGNETAVNVNLIPSADFVDEYRERTGFVRTMALLSLGVGAAGIVGAGGLYYWGRQQTDDYNRRVSEYNTLDVQTSQRYNKLAERRRAIARTDVGALTAAGVGLAGLATGFALIALGDDPGRYDDVRQETTIPGSGAAPLFGLSMGGATVSWFF